MNYKQNYFLRTSNSQKLPKLLYPGLAHWQAHPKPRKLHCVLGYNPKGHISWVQCYLDTITKGPPSYTSDICLTITISQTSKSFSSLRIFMKQEHVYKK